MKTKLLDLVQFSMRSWLIKEVFRFEGNTVLGEGVANTILKNTGRNKQHRWKYCAQQWIYKYDPENTGSNRRRGWKYCARQWSYKYNPDIYRQQQATQLEILCQAAQTVRNFHSRHQKHRRALART